MHESPKVCSTDLSDLRTILIESLPSSEWNRLAECSREIALQYVQDCGPGHLIAAFSRFFHRALLCDYVAINHGPATEEHFANHQLRRVKRIGAQTRVTQSTRQKDGYGERP